MKTHSEMLPRLRRASRQLCLQAGWLLPLLTATHASATSLQPPRLTGHIHPGDTQGWVFDLRLERPAPARLTCQEVGGLQERHVKTLEAARLQTVTFHGLKADTTYRCEAVTLDGTNLRSAAYAVVTPSLPLDLKAPQITVPSADVAATGYTLYGYGIYRGGFKNNYLVILDARGQIRWYLPGPGAGDVDSSYVGLDRLLYGGMSATYYVPTLVGLDKVVQWKGTTATVSPSEQVGQTNHDAGLSEDGKSVFHLNYEKLDGYYLTFIVKQIDLASNKVVWSWDSIVDGLNVGELPPGSGGSDLYHANSIDDQWENGRLYLYVGLRNLHRVLKIDYLTKQVVWQLGVGGDFTLLEANGTPATSNARWFFHQHDVKVMGPEMITMYDNGTARNQYGGTNYSRALKLELDQDAMTARIVSEYKEEGWAEAYWGGYDVLENGNGVIAMGHMSTASTGHNSAIVEINPAGTVVWRADFRSDKDAIYRTERIGGCEIFDNAQYCPGI